MPNEIKALYTTGAFTITGLNLLASSPTYYTGWMSELVNNTSTKFQQVLVYVRLNQGTSPTVNKNAFVFGIRGDTQTPAGNIHVTDGGTDAQFSAAPPTGQGRLIVYNAPLLGIMANRHNAVTDDSVWGEFMIDQPGPYFGIAVSHDFGSALDSTGNYARWVGINPEIQ